jgi:hypothetical protein
LQVEQRMSTLYISNVLGLLRDWHRILTNIAQCECTWRSSQYQHKLPASTNQFVFDPTQQASMSCAKTVRSILISDSAGGVLGSAIEDINEVTSEIKAAMNRFEVAHTALVTCTTLTDLEAHWLEGGTHLKAAFKKLKKFHEFSTSLNVEAVFMLARQCGTWRGLTDEQLKAGVERQVVEARTYMRNATQRFNPKE